MTIDGGGSQVSTGGDYVLSVTIGQPDAGEMSGGEFELNCGFWFPVAAGDGNGDGVVDLADYDDFEDCLNGPGGGSQSGSCTFYDADGNGAVDLSDFALVQASFSGS